MKKPTSFNSFTKSITSQLFDFIILLGAAATLLIIITRTMIHLHLNLSLHHRFTDFHLEHATDQGHRIRRQYQTCLDYLFQKIQRIHSTYLFISLCTQLKLMLLLRSDLSEHLHCLYPLFVIHL